jgi:hypothetical protein
VRDRDTGTATSVDSNGILTVSPSSGGILRLWVLAPGYTVYTYTNDDSGAGTNFIETEPLDPRVFGEWIVYKVVDSSTNEEYAVYDERVTFRPDGSVSREGARVYGNVGFGQTSGIEWASLSSSAGLHKFYIHVGLLRYICDNDNLSMAAIGPTAPDLRRCCSRDGLDPDGSDGGSVRPDDRP